MAKREACLAKAEELLERLGGFDEIRRYYEAREMAIHDDKVISKKTGLPIEEVTELRIQQ